MVSNKTAIVIGATGLVGSSLVDLLADAEHVDQVITLTRNAVKHRSPKVVNHVVDFECLGDYSPLFNADLFFSCLGTTKKQVGSIAAQRKVDLDYQFEAAQLAAQSGVSHYLLVSASSANEQSKNAYLQMKGELEKRVVELPFKRISIFQPSLLLGNRKEFRLGEELGRYLLPLLCLIPGLRKYRPIKGEQVAAKMLSVSRQVGPPLEWFCLDEIFEGASY